MQGTLICKRLCFIQPLNKSTVSCVRLAAPVASCQPRLPFCPHRKADHLCRRVTSPEWSACYFYYGALSLRCIFQQDCISLCNKWSSVFNFCEFNLSVNFFFLPLSSGMVRFHCQSSWMSNGPFVWHPNNARWLWPDLGVRHSLHCYSITES